VLKIEAPSVKHWPMMTQKMLDEGLHWPKMEGRHVYKHAVKRMPEAVNEALAANKIDSDDIDLFLFHQANLRINEAVMQQIQQPMTKSYNNIDRYGNCSSASIPICLDECVRSNRIKKGDLICMSSFGAGFTWGSAIMRW
jgi:3-oxoacyl-[acyl-carrier-protein] synthase-3